MRTPALVFDSYPGACSHTIPHDRDRCVCGARRAVVEPGFQLPLWEAPARPSGARRAPVALASLICTPGRLFAVEAV